MRKKAVTSEARWDMEIMKMTREGESSCPVSTAGVMIRNSRKGGDVSSEKVRPTASITTHFKICTISCLEKVERE